MEEQSTTIGQYMIKLEWPAKVLHQSKEDELLGQLYKDEPARRATSDTGIRSIEKLIIKEELPGGFGGARVLVVIPVEQNGTHQAARVVKLGPRVMLEAERNNYNNFVQQHLTIGVANLMRFTHQGTLAAIEYVFVGGGWLDPVSDLTTYYQQTDAAEFAKTLEALLHDHLGQAWFRQDSLLEEHTVVEYGPHLPAQISLTLRLGSEDWLGPAEEASVPGIETYHALEIETLLRSQTPLEADKLVHVEGLEVVRIKPWAATLEHHQERSVRIRVEYEPTSGIAEQLRIGQPVTVRGKMLATRHGLLETIARAAFDKVDGIEIIPDDDQVLYGLGRHGPYPNPLKIYPTLLDEMLVGRRSIIHGDLHLRNVLVDGDGRPWLIDFGRVREGHTLFDFIKLETYLRLDVLSKTSGFTLAEYARFEEALADAHNGLWAAAVPTNRELRKAFYVIRAIRRQAGRLYPQKTPAKTYFRCLLLYNLAVLKYAREAALTLDNNSAEHNHQLQAARLSFIVASIQRRYLENPAQPWPRVRGVLAQLPELWSEWVTRFRQRVLYLSMALFLVILLGLGLITYQFQLQARQERARNLSSQCAISIEQGNLETAENLCRQAIQADPHNPVAHHNLGMVYYIQGDLEQAIEDFREAIDLDSSYVSPHFALGRVYDDQGHVEEAVNEFQRAIELDPGMSVAYSEIGYILNRQERYTEAVAILQKGLERGSEPNPPFLHKNLGQAFLGLGDPIRAGQHLEIAAAQLNPNDGLYIEIHRLLAEAYEEKGDLEKALEEWQDPLRNEPDAQERIQQILSIIDTTK